MQPANTLAPIEVTLLGMVTLVSLVQPENVSSAIEATLSGMVTLVRLHPENAPAPMLTTLSGIATLATLVLSMKAWPPMLVTGRPLIVSGMVTTPPAPVYPVMVIVPSLVV